MSVSRAACVLILAAVAGAAAAQSFPTRPIRIIVGYTAGGGNDIIARVVAAKMADGLGQPVLIENRAGAQGIIAAELVAKSPADGYTLLMAPTGPMAINPAIYSKLPYAPLEDFAPISLLGQFPLLLVVSAALPVASVKELVEYARARPNDANYASSAAPFQLAAELFNQRMGTRFAHIPFKGSGDSVNAVAAGQVTMTISDAIPIAGPLKGGRIRGLAVTSGTRHPAFPDVPTMAEAGVSDMEIRLWTGFVAPAKTPAPVVARLHEEIVRVLALPDVRERLAGLGVDPGATTPDEYARIIAADIARWTAVAKAANIKAD
jgi:tripartite-type tricarboxylate transporter receptor subunit TctC